MSFVKVKNKEGLYRDKNTNAIVNMNQNEYNSYIDSYKKIINENKRIESLENDINNIKSDLSEIKEMLRNLSK